jgi:hypothetical protein
MRKRLEGARAGKQRGKWTMKGVLQSQEARVELAIPGAPKAKFLVVLLAVKLSKRLQLVDLSIAALNFGIQRRAKLIHLAPIFRGEDFSLLGQLMVKLQPQL